MVIWNPPVSCLLSLLSTYAPLPRLHYIAFIVLQLFRRSSAYASSTFLLRSTGSAYGFLALVSDTLPEEYTALMQSAGSLSSV